MSWKPYLIPIDTTVPEQYRNLTDDEYIACVLAGYAGVDALRASRDPSSACTVKPELPPAERELIRTTVAHLRSMEHENT